MTAAVGDPGWDAIVSTWGHAYHVSHDPGASPGRRHRAQAVTW